MATSLRSAMGLLIIVSFLFLSEDYAMAQKSADIFTEIAQDPSGDSHSGLSDAKSLSYAFSSGGDTIYLRLETYEARSGEFGVAFGLNTDHDPQNGKPWLGSTNNSVRWDYRVVVARNAIFEPEPSMQIYSSSDQPLQAGHFTIVSPTVIEVALSLAALNGDMSIGIVAGTGAFDIAGSSAADDIPNSGYVMPMVSSVDPNNSTVGNGLSLSFLFDRLLNRSSESTMNPLYDPQSYPPRSSAAAATDRLWTLCSSGYCPGATSLGHYQETCAGS